MKMFAGKSFTNSIFSPECLFGQMAFRAMPVSTTIIADKFIAAMVAAVLMSSHRSRTAFSQCIQNANLIGIREAVLNKWLAKSPDYVGYFP